jgi:hypothetical protein
MSNGNTVVESNHSFGPIELGYYPIGSGSYWYAKGIQCQCPAQGYKIPGYNGFC